MRSRKRLRPRLPRISCSNERRHHGACRAAAPIRQPLRLDRMASHRFTFVRDRCDAAAARNGVGHRQRAHARWFSPRLLSGPAVGWMFSPWHFRASRRRDVEVTIPAPGRSEHHARQGRLVRVDSGAARTRAVVNRRVPLRMNASLSPQRMRSCRDYGSRSRRALMSIDNINTLARPPPPLRPRPQAITPQPLTPAPRGPQAREISPCRADRTRRL